MLREPDAIGQLAEFLTILVLAGTELDDHAGIVRRDIAATDVADIFVMIEVGTNRRVLHMLLLRWLHILTGKR
jgi:hypothetical protein